MIHENIGLYQIKNCSVKGTVRNCLGNIYLMQDLNPKYKKKLLKFSNNKIKNPILKLAKDLHKRQRRNTMSNKSMRRCSASYIIKDLQIKTTMTYYTPIRMTRIQKPMIPN